MTYCLGIRIREGLVALADGRVTSGSQMAAAQKLTMMGGERDRFFVMTSGLRSVRDKVLTYLRRNHDLSRDDCFPTVLDAATEFTRCLRQVATEDKAHLEAADLKFNLHAIIGGRLAQDAEPAVFLIYPEGNWITVDQRMPYLSIGTTAYGKPILDRALKYETRMRDALKLAYLSFDSSRFSSTDVGFPIDLLTYNNDDRVWRQTHFEYDDLRDQRLWWNREITQLAERLPDQHWVGHLLPAEATRLSVVAEDGG